jgi:hypothetical protein
MQGNRRHGLIAGALALVAAVIAVVILARREAGPDGPPADAAPAAEQAERAAPGSGTLPGGPAAPPPAEVPTAGPTDRDLQVFDGTMAWARAERLDTLPIGEIIVRIGRRFVGAPYRPGLLEVPGPERLVVNLREYDCVTYVETMLALARMVRAGEGNAGSSPKLADSANLEAIRATEQRLSTQARHVIPEDRIAEAAPRIRNGDIIAATSSTRGLDIAHTGLAI